MAGTAYSNGIDGIYLAHNNPRQIDAGRENGTNPTLLRNAGG
jgi:hypothetical protein